MCRGHINCSVPHHERKLAGHPLRNQGSKLLHLLDTDLPTTDETKVVQESKPRQNFLCKILALCGAYCHWDVCVAQARKYLCHTRVQTILHIADLGIALAVFRDQGHYLCVPRHPGKGLEGFVEWRTNVLC